MRRTRGLKVKHLLDFFKGCDPEMDVVIVTTGRKVGSTPSIGISCAGSVEQVLLFPRKALSIKKQKKK